MSPTSPPPKGSPVLPEAARLLAGRFWPGPLTLVLPRRAGAGLAERATAGLPSVALRVPQHPLAQRLLAAFGGPLAAPSANPSGRVSATTAAHVLEGLGGRIAAVIDGGACPLGLESTIIGFEGDAPVLLRPGGLPVEAIAEALGRPLGAPAEVRVTAPGQLASHYAPSAALRLDAAAPRPGEVWLGFGPDAAAQVRGSTSRRPAISRRRRRTYSPTCARSTRWPSASAPAASPSPGCPVPGSGSR